MSRSIPTATQPQMVLQSYLDDLLHEATQDLEPPVVTVAPVEVPVVDPEPILAPQPVRPEPAPRLDYSEPAPTPPVLDIPLPQVTLERSLPVILPKQEPRPEPVADQPVTTVATSDSLAAVPQSSLAQIPQWAEGPFECLLFNVAGLTLAVPLVSLGSIYPLDEQELTPLFGQPEWFLGILSSPSGNLKILETARWLIPDRYRDEFREDLKYAISVQGYDWALAVHQVSRSVRLHPDEVKWRTQRTQRPWLAGTVIEHMCALLDITALAELIASGATRHKDFLSGK